MRKINFRKIAIVGAWLIALATLFISLAFVSKSEKNIVAENLNIVLHNVEENQFLSEAEVQKYLNDRNDQILNQKYRGLNTAELEKALNAHAAIENAEVSEDLNGEIKLEITQRTPILRIIDKNGESYYVDTQDKLMPLNENFSARVLVASGELDEPYDRRYQFTIGQIAESETYRDLSMLDDVVEVAKIINADTLLTKLVHQIFVNKEKEIELYPVIGTHRIVLGESKYAAEKLNKLKLFYREGLNKTDGWTKYSTINLKFKNLVVCTKK